MRTSMVGVLACAVLAAHGCGNGIGPDEAEEKDEFNPALLDAVNEWGLEGAPFSELPVAPGTVVGPDGRLFDAIALEYAQELILTKEGTDSVVAVIWNSGVKIQAVPSLADAEASSFVDMTVGLRNQGSLESAEPGVTYSIQRRPIGVDISSIILYGVAWVTMKTDDPAYSQGKWYEGHEGSIRFHELNFGEPTACGLPLGPQGEKIRCSYQTGRVAGTFDFVSGPRPGDTGPTTVQTSTTFSLPAIRHSWSVKVPCREGNSLCNG